MNNHKKSFFDKYRKNLLSKKGRKSSNSEIDFLAIMLANYPTLTIASLTAKNKT